MLPANTLRCRGPPVARPSSVLSVRETEIWCSFSHHLSASLELCLVSRWVVFGEAIVSTAIEKWLDFPSTIAHRIEVCRSLAQFQIETQGLEMRRRCWPQLDLFQVIIKFDDELALATSSSSGKWYCPYSLKKPNNVRSRP
jgi:hypothetical protein